MRLTINILLLYPALLLLAVSAVGDATAQLPDCRSSRDMVYLHLKSVNAHFNWNPFQLLSVTNPIPNASVVLQNGDDGLAICDNLNSSTGPSPTFYTTRRIGSTIYYCYHDGSSWVNTGHTAGSSNSVNLGGGGGYMYSLDGTLGHVYQYDGTGNASLILAIPGWTPGLPSINAPGAYDIVGDCEGNFYLLMFGAQQSWLRKYSPSAILMHEWDVFGVPSPSSGAIAIAGNTLVVSVNFMGIYTGTIGTNTINLAYHAPVTFTMPGNSNPADFASCPYIIPGVKTHVHDTLFTCPSAPEAVVTASGATPFSYTVLDGTASVTGSGPEFNITATTAATIVLHSKPVSPCDLDTTVNDTFVVVPMPALAAHTDDTIIGCAPYRDTLHAVLANTTSWVDYTITWSPSGMIVSGSNTLNPVVSPLSDVTAVVTVSTGPEHGGCTISDSVRIRINKPAKHTIVELICANEPYRFGGVWLDTPGIYYDTLVAANGCDSVVTLNLIVLPVPELSVAADEGQSFCLGDSVLYQANGAESYWWYAGNKLTGSLDYQYIHLSDMVNNRIIVGIANNNCRDTADLSVKAEACCDMFIPNAFTPNGDGKNDRFGPVSKGNFQDYQIQIFNRWGQRVFLSADMNTYWDGSHNGQPADVGVYYYVTVATCLEGTEIIRKGDITLIR